MKPIQKNIIQLSDLCINSDHLKEALVFEVPQYINIDSVLMTAEEFIKEIDVVNMDSDWPEECGTYEDFMHKLNECKKNDWLIDIEN
jgi:hypothetical protein